MILREFIRGCRLLVEAKVNDEISTVEFEHRLAMLNNGSQEQLFTEHESSETMSDGGVQRNV